jgi:hypothetical protein
MVTDLSLSVSQDSSHILMGPRPWGQLVFSALCELQEATGAQRGKCVFSHIARQGPWSPGASSLAADSRTL